MSYARSTEFSLQFVLTASFLLMTIQPDLTKRNFLPNKNLIFWILSSVFLCVCVKMLCDTFLLKRRYSLAHIDIILTTAVA